MIEIVLVEGVSDVRLISYYLQNIYGWKYENIQITQSNSAKFILPKRKKGSATSFLRRG